MLKFYSKKIVFFLHTKAFNNMTRTQCSFKIHSSNSTFLKKDSQKELFYNFLTDLKLLNKPI